MAGYPHLSTLMIPTGRVGKDLLPGLIAAGILSCAEYLFLGRVSWPPPLFGLLAGGAVYAADHRVQPNGHASLKTWALLLTTGMGMLAIIIFSGQFNHKVLFFYLMLSLSYVLHLPGTTYRIQNSPALRLLAISGGWAGIPFILQGISMTRAELGYFTGLTGLFFSGVLWSDLADREEDLENNRPTFVQSIQISLLQRLMILGYSISLLSFFLSDFLPLTVAPVLGLASVAWVTSHRVACYADWLLLWPGIVALWSRFGF